MLILMGYIALLVITNLYPPHHIGGYEINCKLIVDRLIQLGHKVIVLTSTYGAKRRISENNVFRFFDFRSDRNHLFLQKHPIIYDGLYLGWKELKNASIL